MPPLLAWRAVVSAGYRRKYGLSEEIWNDARYGPGSGDDMGVFGGQGHRSMWTLISHERGPVAPCLEIGPNMLFMERSSVQLDRKELQERLELLDSQPGLEKNLLRDSLWSKVPMEEPGIHALQGTTIIFIA